MSRPPAQPNQSLIDGIAVLQAVASRREPTSCSKLAVELGMDVTRVNRLLKTLEYLDVVRQNRSRRYLAGSGMHLLSAQSLYASGLLRRALPELEKLHGDGVTVALGVCWRGQVSYWYHHTDGVRFSASFNEAPNPAGGSSIGRVLLAQRDDAELRREFGESGVPGYDGALEDFLAETARIRADGYARLFHYGHYNLAMPLKPTTGAAVAVTGIHDETRLPYYLDCLRSTVRTIDAALD